MDMGFTDRDEVRRALLAAWGDMSRAVEYLSNVCWDASGESRVASRTASRLIPLRKGGKNQKESTVKNGTMPD